jgi:hypothetical protein
VCNAAGSPDEKESAALVFGQILRRWTMVYELFGLMKAARMLEPCEIIYLTELCALYGEEFRKESRQQWRLNARKKKVTDMQLHLPLKLHFLEVEVPKFARKWGSIGLFSEDAAESIHALMNRLNRRYANIRSSVERAKCVIMALSIVQKPSTIAASEALAARRKR